MQKNVLYYGDNLDVIKAADWVIDLGREGGGAGGESCLSKRPGPSQR